MCIENDNGNFRSSQRGYNTLVYDKNDKEDEKNLANISVDYVVIHGNP